MITNARQFALVFGLQVEALVKEKQVDGMATVMAGLCYYLAAQTMANKKSRQDLLTPLNIAFDDIAEAQMKLDEILGGKK